jgi:hypothetical protein
MIARVKPPLVFIVASASLACVCSCAAETSQQVQPAAVAQEISVPGMSRYQDDLGFSFWYPSVWSVNPQPINNCASRPRPEPCPDNAGGWLQEGTVVKQLKVGSSQTSIASVIIQVFHSPSSSIAERGATQFRYFFDSATGSWMQTILKSTERDLSAPVTAQASILERTMGGLPILAGAARHGADSIVPLKDGNFVVVESMDPGNPDQRYLARTIEPADPPAESASTRRQAITDWLMHSESLK